MEKQIDKELEDEILKLYGFENFNDKNYIRYMSTNQFKSHLRDVIKLTLKEAQKGMIKIEDVEKMIDERLKYLQRDKKDINARQNGLSYNTPLIRELILFKQSLKELG